MTTKIYSKVDSIPRGSASERLTNGCLVLEGGGFRGVYTAGFLDAMMENDLNLSCVIGVSAGALGGVNYVAGQIGRSARINLTYRHDSRYVGAKAAIHSHSFLDVSFLTEERGIIPEPLDTVRFYRPEQRFLAVAANCQTGQTCYFEKGRCSDILAAVRASATMPFISPEVMIDGVPYLDGGCTCKIPYEWAIREGFEKVLVVRTRPVSFRKPDTRASAALNVYRKYPEFAEKLANSNIDYNFQCVEIERLHAQGRLLRLAPSEPVTVSRVEKDMEKLGALYWLGHHDCMAHLEEIQAYLA